ncbi:cytochrome P450 [Aspergillus californicus]
MDIHLPDNLSTTATFVANEARPYFSVVLLVTTVLTLLFFAYARGENPLAGIPLVTEKSFWDFTGRKAKASFAANARAVIKSGFDKVGSSNPFRILSDQGEMLILPPGLANDIRNIEALSHAEFMKESTCAEVPGFEPYLESTGSTLLTDMTKTKLMSSLKWLSTPLSRTCANACSDLFPADNEWHEVILKDALLDLVARLSSVIFLGDEEVSSDPAWLRITKEYTIDSFVAFHQLRPYPRFLKPYIAPFFSQARKVRAQLQEAESIITPVIERRRAEKAQAIQRGEGDIPERYDSIEWLEIVAKEKGITYSPAAMQLTLALSAIHTTTDLLTTTMYEILAHPEIIPALREEARSVIGDGGLKHSSLYSLKLMDSVIKEAQRLKPVLSINMVRIATGNIDLPNGFHIPKGTRLGVSSHASWDPSVFPDPHKFDPYRFVRLREQPGQENVWQLTTTRPEQIAFGHGLHACPGRFLAANEAKIALCHLLLKHDWEMTDVTMPKAISHGIMLDSDPTVKVRVRARESEVQL